MAKVFLVVLTSIIITRLLWDCRIHSVAEAVRIFNIYYILMSSLFHTVGWAVCRRGRDSNSRFVVVRADHNWKSRASTLCEIRKCLADLLISLWSNFIGAYSEWILGFEIRQTLTVLGQCTARSCWQREPITVAASQYIVVLFTSVGFLVARLLSIETSQTSSFSSPDNSF